MLRRCGFTLIELITALAIVALLAAIAIPVYSAVQQQATYKSYLAQANTLAQAVSSFYAVNGCYPDNVAANTMPANLGAYVGGPWPAGYNYHAWTNSTGTGAGTATTAYYVGVGTTLMPNGDTLANIIWVANHVAVPTC